MMHLCTNITFICETITFLCENKITLKVLKMHFVYLKALHQVYYFSGTIGFHF